MMVFATLGATGLYLLFIWLLSAAGAGWLAERKGYGERVGLTFGLLLTALGFLIVLLLPGRPGSVWKEEGWMPRRRQAVAGGPAAARLESAPPRAATTPPAAPPPDPPPPDAPAPGQAPPPDAQ